MPKLRQSKFQITLVGTPGDDVAHIHTLRSLLKRLLRGHGLHCADIRQVDDRHDADHLHHNDDGGK
jgi:hypothetical protein